MNSSMLSDTKCMIFALRIYLLCFFVVRFGEIFGPQTQPTPDEMSDFFSAMLWNEGYLVSDRSVLNRMNRCNRDI